MTHNVSSGTLNFRHTVEDLRQWQDDLVDAGTSSSDSDTVTALLNWIRSIMSSRCKSHQLAYCMMQTSVVLAHIRDITCCWPSCIYLCIDIYVRCLTFDDVCWTGLCADCIVVKEQKRCVNWASARQDATETVCAVMLYHLFLCQNLFLPFGIY